MNCILLNNENQVYVDDLSGVCTRCISVSSLDIPLQEAQLETQKRWISGEGLDIFPSNILMVDIYFREIGVFQVSCAHGEYMLAWNQFYFVGLLEQRFRLIWLVGGIHNAFTFNCQT